MAEDTLRLQDRARRPAVVRLARALAPLRSVLAFMSTGAHPDDETSALLAALSLRDGWRVSYACSTRGEGGQNAIGPEAGADLGALRTREMEEAARVLRLQLYWLGFGPDDPVHDFGFSKDGDATFARWGRERVVERLVAAIRRERPDALCPTFLDVPGQHGHHRAMTRAAIEAVARAADPAAWPEHAGRGLPPWQVAKLYLPAWSGAGTSYDDDLPPPNATVAVEAGGRDPITGEPWPRLAELSRSYHRTQGMGRWVAPGPRPISLHRLAAAPGMPDHEAAIDAGLPSGLADLADEAGAAAASLREADDAIRTALAAWPHGQAVAAAAVRALRTLRGAALPPGFRSRHGHRIDRAVRALGQVLLEARGQDIVARSCSPLVVRGGTVRVVVEPGGQGPLPPVRLRLPESWRARDAAPVWDVDIPADAALADPFGAGFDPAGGNGPVGVVVDLDADGIVAAVDVDLDEPLAVVPAVAVEVEPPALVLNRAGPRRRLEVRLLVTGAAPATVALHPPEGWAIEPASANVDPAGGQALTRTTLVPPAALRDGLATVPVLADGEPALTLLRLGYPHTGTTVRTAPALLRVRTLEVLLPEGVRLGYVGGGNDRVDHWLSAVGLDPRPLDAAVLASGDLAAFDTILVGIFAFGTRPDLCAALPRLHDWVRAGGHLVTLYHRPWDGWDPERVPLARLVVGQPSIRWRVTDPAAPVAHLVPDHALLAGPNRIGPADWAGWEKERGLYFAAAWDPAYVPLLAMADEGEAPLEGALLSGRFGAGRHTHTSLVLHQQLERLVPGAFRLLANLVQPARPG